MTVYKVPHSRYYQYRFMIDGKLYKGSTRRSRKAEAEQIVTKERKKVLDQKQLGHLPETTLHEAVTYWLDNLQTSDHAYERETSMVRVMFDLSSDKRSRRQWTWDKKMKFHELSEGDLKKLVNTRTKEGLSPSTIRLELAILSRTRSALRGIYRVPEIAFPTARRDKRIKSKPKLRYLREEEVTKVLSILENMPDDGRSIRWITHRQDALDLAILLLDTGMRPAIEGMSLAWTQVGLNEGTIHVHRPKVANWSTLEMTERVQGILTRRYAAREGNPYVFPNRNPRKKGALPHMVQCRMIQTAIDLAKCNTDEKVKQYGGKATVHTLRDTYATRLLQNGLSLKAVSQLLGHTSVKQTEKYAHLVPQTEASAAADILNKLDAV